jgi:PPK2 family polyphosphate:nucleotide phosphotransferase
MLPVELTDEFAAFQIKAGKKVRLADYATGYKGNLINKEQGSVLLETSTKGLEEIQDRLYAASRYGVMIILQAMDAAGKDGAVKHVMSGLNPLGVNVYSFKAPTAQELDHDYLWRHAIATPGRGEIAIHNRSHYENVLVTRVHPEYILKEHLPGIEAVSDISSDFWAKRFRQINRFEKNLHQNGIIVLKFFLHVSQQEQKKRLLERIDDPAKNWKFSVGDVDERARWDDYQEAYEEALEATSKKHAPWYVIPADDKWYTRLAIASIIHQTLDALTIEYPVLPKDQIASCKAAI